LESRLKNEVEKDYREWENRYNLLYEKLSNLSPLQTLKRGYAVLQDEKGKTVTSVDDINIGDRIKGRLSDGIAQLKVEAAQKVGDFNE